MSLGNGSSFNSGPLVFLTPRGKDKDGNKLDKPYFSVGRVGEDGKIAQTDETPSSVSGNLVSAQIKDREFTRNGVKETAREVALYIRDNSEEPGVKETYRLGLTFSIPACGLFNGLASLIEKGDFSNLSVDYYRNKKGYETYGLKQNGEQVKWKYDLESVPKGEPMYDKKGKLVKNDYTERDAFFENVLSEIIAKLGGNKQAAQDSGDESVEDNGEQTEKQPETPAKTVAKTTGTPVAQNKAATSSAKAKTVAQQEPLTTENLDEDVPF